MKRTGQIITGVIIAGIGIIALTWFLISTSTISEPQKKRQFVTVVVSDSTDSRWVRFRAGLEKAADDYDVSLNYAVTGKFESPQEQMHLISGAASASDGLIVQLEESEGSEETVRDIARTTVLELIDIGETFSASEEGSYAGIGTDSRAIGASLAETVKNDMAESEGPEELRIGIISSNQRLAVSQERLSALTEALEVFGITPVWIAESAQSVKSYENVNTVIALDNTNLEQAGDILRTDQEPRIRLYGIGCSDKTIYYLDRGLIAAMIVPDDFRMGYLAMTEVHNRLNTPNIPMKDRQVSFEVITKDNLYSKKHESMLFPIIN